MCQAMELRLCKLNSLVLFLCCLGVVMLHAFEMLLLLCYSEVQNPCSFKSMCAIFVRYFYGKFEDCHYNFTKLTCVCPTCQKDTNDKL